MKKTILVMAFLLLLLVRGFGAQTSEHVSPPHVHKKYAQLKNPIPLSEQSVRAGKDIFEKHCIACHGRDAKGGNGPDLTDEQWIHGPSDGEIFHVISDGTARTVMKGYKDELSEEMRWHLVNYIRSSRIKRSK